MHCPMIKLLLLFTCNRFPFFRNIYAGAAHSIQLETQPLVDTSNAFSFLKRFSIEGYKSYDSVARLTDFILDNVSVSIIDSVFICAA